MKYKKKPVVVEAVQFTDTEESILKLSELGLDPVRIDYADTDNPILKIETLEGLMIAAKGDYIIKGVQENFIHASRIFSQKRMKKQRSAENMTREEWIQFSVISVIYAIVHITIELIKERRKK